MKRFRTFVKEGGNAFDNVTSINLANVNPTINKISSLVSRKLKIPSKSLFPVGSVGKKKVSGDLDLAIDVGEVIKRHKTITPQEIQATVWDAVKTIDSGAKKLGGFAVTFRMPIVNKDGDQADQFVQTDIFPTDDPELTKFTKWSPAESESKYKGVHRNILLANIVKHMDLKVLKQVDDIPVRWERLLLDFSRGLVRAVQSKEGKKGILSKHKTIDRKLVSKNVPEIVDMILGPSFGVRDTNSFESLMSVIKSAKFPYKKNRDKILQDTADSFINNGLLMPSELKRYVK